ncbi:MAG: hypothetical protein ACKN9S_12065 [Pirellula sp.]
MSSAVSNSAPGTGTDVQEDPTESSPFVPNPSQKDDFSMDWTYIPKVSRYRVIDPDPDQPGDVFTIKIFLMNDQNSILTSDYGYLVYIGDDAGFGPVDALLTTGITNNQPTGVLTATFPRRPTKIKVTILTTKKVL